VTGSELGSALWELLPAAYRAEDGRGGAAPPGLGPEPGDLELLLEAAGALLDRIRATLDQRLADCFPDDPVDGGPAAQAWLLPYFARLVDARLRSPHVVGRRREVAEAIAWRQRKGTLRAAEAIAEAAGGRAVSGLGGREVELQEGLRRVATTARVNEPPAGRLTAPPATTVTVSRPMRAVQVDADLPGARRSSFGGDVALAWAVGFPAGAPCFPGHFDDISRRTVDLRGPDAGGHVHPKRLLVYAAPPLGFFRRGHSAGRGAPEGTPRQDEVVRTGDEPEPLRDAHVGTLRVPGGRVTLERCTIEHLVLDGAAPAGGPQLDARDCVLDELSATGAVVLRDCTLRGPAALAGMDATGCLAFGPADAAVVSATGDVELAECAVQALEAASLRARDTLLGTVTASGTARLEYATVLGSLTAGELEASDCLLAGALRFGAAGPRGCVRYTRLPPGAPAGDALLTHVVTTAAPVFFDPAVCDPEPPSVFARPGSGVLHPTTPPAVRFGAEDGGELGAYHREAHSLEQQALVEQVADHLPQGVRPVLILDARLQQPPPSLSDPLSSG
jgi:hypothetical protein